MSKLSKCTILLGMFLFIFQGFGAAADSKGTLITNKIVEWVEECLIGNYKTSPMNTANMEISNYHTQFTNKCCTLIEAAQLRNSEVVIEDVDICPILFKLLE